ASFRPLARRPTRRQPWAKLVASTRLVRSKACGLGVRVCTYKPRVKNGLGPAFNPNPPRRLHRPEVRRWTIKLKRQEKATTILGTAHPNNFRGLLCTGNRINDRKLLIRPKRQAQVDETAVRVHYQR